MPARPLPSSSGWSILDPGPVDRLPCYNAEIKPFDAD